MIRVFPIALPATATVCGAFGDCRGGPTCPRKHQGVDLCAPEGTPILAVDDGNMTLFPNELGGIAIMLHAPDGTRYYMAHLSRVEGEPRRVVAGEIVGYVGHTGDAVAALPHLHIEMHVPPSGAAVDPLSALQAAPRQAPRRPLGGALVAAGVILAAGSLAAWAVWR